MKGYTVFHASVVVIESGKGDPPWVIFHSRADVEKCVSRICEKHESECRKTEPPEYSSLWE